MLARQVANDVLLSYGTLLLQRRLDALLPLNAALTDYALKLRATEPGLVKSNTGGWQSEGNIFARDEPLIGQLSQHAHVALQHISMLARQDRKSVV